MISCDKIIPELIKDKNIDLVISTSSLKVLASVLAAPEDYFEIPVIINQGSNGEKVIFIDKPLASLNVPASKKMKTYYKKITQSKFAELGSQDKKPMIMYNMWEFGDLQLLIRSKIHATSSSRIINLQTKLEYQIDRGFESISEADRVKWWISTIARPGSELFIGK